MRRIAMYVGEIAATTTGHQYLLADLVGTLQYKDAPAAIAGGDSAHQARGASAENDHIKVVHRGNIAGHRDSSIMV